MAASEISKQTPQPQDFERTRSKSFEVLLTDVKSIIEHGKLRAYQSVSDIIFVNFARVRAKFELDSFSCMPYMPIEEEIRREIERQKEIYRLQEKNK